MEDNKLKDFFLYKLVPVVKEQKILFSLIGVILVMGLVTLLIPSFGKNTMQAPAPLPVNNSDQLVKTKQIMKGKVNNGTTSASLQEVGNTSLQKTKNTDSSGKQIAQSQNKGATPSTKPNTSFVTPTVITSNASSSKGSTQNNNQSVGTSQGGSSGGGSATPTSTPTPTPTSGTSNSQSQNNANNQSNTNSPNNNTNIPTPVPPQIVFIDQNGQQQSYNPPSTPPVDITWYRYSNGQEHFEIDYPSNWQVVSTTYAGHEAVFIYEPGANPGDPNVQYISFGWSTYFYPPQANYAGPFMLGGVPGTIYTNGSLGSSFIAGVFQYDNGFLVLNNNISDATFAYVFDHMLLSLAFYTQ